MDENSVISIRNLSKVYKIFDKPTDRVKEALHPFHKRYSKDFYALNDVSLTIKKGETVGIIGKNGAGKSTLLKIITGVLTPTSGTIQVSGRIASLLELGAGFNPEMTGVENIYMNGALMGYSKEEIDGKLQDIIDFADIGDFINQPVKMYSSGMFARLAFSVNATLEPDILIVDEALSVGDFMFQFKCLQRFKKLQEKGITILFVTHSMQEIMTTCNRAIFIHEGKILYDSYDVEQVIYHYESHIRNTDKTSTKDINCELKEKKLQSQSKTSDVNENRMGNFAAIINDFYFETPNEILVAGKNTKGKLIIYSKKFIKKIVFGFSLKNVKGEVIWGDNTTRVTKDISLNPGMNIIGFSADINIMPGEYLLYVGLADISGPDRVELDQRWPMKRLQVIGFKTMPEGMVYAPMSFYID